MTLGLPALFFTFFAKRPNTCVPRELQAFAQIFFAYCHLGFCALGVLRDWGRARPQAVPENPDARSQSRPIAGSISAAVFAFTPGPLACFSPFSRIAPTRDCRTSCARFAKACVTLCHLVFLLAPRHPQGVALRFRGQDARATREGWGSRIRMSNEDRSRRISRGGGGFGRGPA